MDTPSTRSAEKIADWIRKARDERGHVLISIDGLLGSGKSALARKLADILSAEHVELDTLVEKGRGTYVEHLRLDEIHTRLRVAQEKASIVLVEGVCARNVLHRLALTPDYSVYVKRLDSRGDWIDGEIFDPDRRVEEVLAEQEDLARSFSALAGEADSSDDSPLSPVQQEVIEYHFACWPHEHADIIYERFDPVGAE